MGEFWRFSHTLRSFVQSSLAFASASPNPWEFWRFPRTVILFAGYSFVIHDGATVSVTPRRTLLMEVTMFAPSHGPHFYQLVDQLFWVTCIRCPLAERLKPWNRCPAKGCSADCTCND